MWTNLIDNAIDATNRTGTIEIVTANAGDRLIVKIIDSGVGIPPEIQSRIFEPFLTTKSVGSSGLGLYHLPKVVR